MKLFRTLCVKGDFEALNDVLKTIEALLAAHTSPWRREPDLESEFRANTATNGFCFSNTTRGALVWLSRTASQIAVINVVPKTSHSLSTDEYNVEVQAFYEELIVPAVANSAIVIEYGPATFSPSDSLGQHVAGLLQTFAGLANPSTGARHPSDTARWREFVIAAHRKNVHIAIDRLERWLVEDAHFPAEIAYELADRYQHDRALLQQNEQSAA